jgi:hypothetical protein
MKRFRCWRSQWRPVAVLCILVFVVGCQSALHNTYPVPGERAGQGLKYYRSAFPRGQRPDPWENQGQAMGESEPGDDGKEEAGTEEPTSR